VNHLRKDLPSDFQINGSTIPPRSPSISSRDLPRQPKSFPVFPSFGNDLESDESRPVLLNVLPDGRDSCTLRGLKKKVVVHHSRPELEIQNCFKALSPSHPHSTYDFFDRKLRSQSLKPVRISPVGRICSLTGVSPGKVVFSSSIGLVFVPRALQGPYRVFGATLPHSEQYRGWTPYMDFTPVS
jgi:hypothetical protein